MHTVPACISSVTGELLQASHWIRERPPPPAPPVLSHPHPLPCPPSPRPGGGKHHGRPEDPTQQGEPWESLMGRP